MEYRHLMRENKPKKLCQHSFANELGKLAQGVGKRVKVTDTIFFVYYEDVIIELHKDITYGRIVVYYRPHKEDTNRTRLTVGFYLLEYPGSVSTPTSDTTTAKIFVIVWFQLPSPITCILT